MKYLKLFEEQVIYSDKDLLLLSDEEKKFLNNLPFKRGDYVRLKDKMVPDPSFGKWDIQSSPKAKIYEIRGISIESRKNFANYSLFDLNDQFLHWFSAEKIVKIPDWERDAMKYNI